MLDLPNATIADLHAALVKGELTVRRLTLDTIRRIMEVDQCAGGLNAVLELNPDALAIADNLDAKLASGERPGPLFGIPILLKDNINTGDKMVTSAGSVALADNFAPRDAHLAARLRQADALILGKANMTEFANFMTTGMPDGMPSGYSSRGGQVYCPFNREQNPRGSSAGSAVAVAAGLVPVSVGTCTGGSVIIPAQTNGVTAMKPTMGLVSRDGILPISGTLDHAGPMARNVRDLALLLTAMAGEDPNDPSTCSPAIRRDIDYAAALNQKALQGARIGVAVNRLDEVDLETLAAFQSLKKTLQQAGATLVEDIGLDIIKDVVPIMKYEFKRCLNAYLAALGPAAPVKTLLDIIRYNQDHADVALRYGQKLLLESENETTGRLVDSAYWKSMADREQSIRDTAQVFADHGLDVLLCQSPTNMTNIGPYTGYPVMTIPIGQKRNNMPIGSYWMARPFDEATLLSICHGAEQALDIRLENPLR